jgi:anti-sigma factor RsiW
MRHIPEDELHAYLDQGLSRSQCVEIESHLADCPYCQATRDGIAAIRDRTTSLLARLAPPRSIPPSFESLTRRADEEISARRRRIQAIGWAASLVLAVGLGYGGSLLLRTTPAPVAPAAHASNSADTVRVPAPALASLPVRDERPAREPARVRPASLRIADSGVARRDREALLSVLDPVPAVELSKLDPPRASGDDLGGMWRTMSWDGAEAEAGKPLSYIDGLPIVQVQVQNAEGARPVTVVAQQLTSGQVIRTIEGSAADVSQLLARRQMSDVDSVQLRGDSVRGANAIEADHSMAMQFGDRMLAITGDLPSDSLRAMIRRMNAEMRSK